MVSVSSSRTTSCSNDDIAVRSPTTILLMHTLMVSHITTPLSIFSSLVFRFALLLLLPSCHNVQNMNGSFVRLCVPCEFVTRLHLLPSMTSVIRVRLCPANIQFEYDRELLSYISEAAHPHRALRRRPHLPGHCFRACPLRPPSPNPPLSAQTHHPRMIVSVCFWFAAGAIDNKLSHRVPEFQFLSTQQPALMPLDSGQVQMKWTFS